MSGMGITTTAQLADVASTVAKQLTTTITRAHDGASFTYEPKVELRAPSLHDPHSDGSTTWVRVSVPVNAVLTRDTALGLMHAFKQKLKAAVGETRISLHTKTNKKGAACTVHPSGWWHMGTYRLDGYWLSMRVVVES